MDDALLVGQVQRLGHPGEQLGRALEVGRAVGLAAGRGAVQPLQHLVERTAVDQVHGEEPVGSVVAQSVDGHDVGMPKAPCRAGFLQEPVDRDLGGREVGGEHLQRDPPSHRGLLGFEHDTHAPPADHTHNVVLVDALRYRDQPVFAVRPCDVEQVEDGEALLQRIGQPRVPSDQGLRVFRSPLALAFEPIGHQEVDLLGSLRHRHRVSAGRRLV